VFQKSILIIAAAGLIGCAEETKAHDAGTQNDKGLIITDGQGADQQQKLDTVGPSCGPGIYPCGPYGKTKGDIIENHQFNAYADADNLCKDPGQKKVDTSKTITLSLKDFYKGDSKCPSKKKKLLWILGSASWCGICKNEIKQVQSAYTQGQIDARIDFINVIIDGNTVGGSPDDTITKNWATTYNLSFPVATDKNRDLATYFTSSGFPLNLLVDTSNMKIYYVKNASSLSTVGAQIAQFFSGK
jgi:hypothetical protein